MIERKISIKKSLHKTGKSEINIESNASGKSILLLILALVGAGILLTAWLAQNYFKNKWLEERLYLERSQHSIEIVQSRLDMWLIQYNQEVVKEPQNKELLMASTYEIIRCVSTLLAWEEARVSGGSYEPIVVKNETLNKAKELYNVKDLDGLLKLSGILIKTKRTFQSQLDGKFFNQIDKTRSGENTWNNIFMWAYIIGSVLLGSRWIMKTLFSWPDKMVWNIKSEEPQKGDRVITGLLGWPDKVVWNISADESKEEKYDKLNSAENKRKR